MIQMPVPVVKARLKLSVLGVTVDVPRRPMGEFNKAVKGLTKAGL